jgi:dihydroneopterin aldolase
LEIESYIYLDEVRFYAFHGVMPQETQVGGEFLVSLRVGYPIQGAMETDDVADTLNYATLLDVVKREMAQPSNLLEHVAGRIGKAIFDSFPQTEAVELTITKLNPPMGALRAGAGVTLHLINDKTQA